MDCRKRFIFSLALLGGMAGCTGTGTKTASAPQGTPITDPAQLAKIDPADIKKEADLPKKQPTPKMCVLWGDMALVEANAVRDRPVEFNEKREMARKAFEQALKLDSKYVPAYQSMAKWYLSVDDVEHAVASLRTALKHHPDDAALWFDLGMIYSSHKDWTPALECLTKAATLEPENRLYVNTLGHAEARAGKLQEALHTYMRVNPEAKAYLNVARMLQHMNQPEQAMQYLQSALARNPQVPGGQELLAQLNGNGNTEVQQTNFDPTQQPGN
jgi:Tfp pilus assembly protein PilF